MNVNINFSDLPLEINKMIFCNHGLTLLDWGNCLKVSKFFKDFLSNESGQWELWAKSFYPDTNWEIVKTSSSFSWKTLVINYKIAEHKELEIICNLAMDVILKASLLKNQFSHLEPFLHSDHPSIQILLALTYKNGYGCRSELSRAFHYFQLVADQGLAEAQYELGVSYWTGRGCLQDKDKAFHYLTLSAHQVFVEAQNTLGFCYETEKDFDKAFYYYQLAANQGHTLALYNLALCYENGRGCPQDINKAFHYFSLAADQKDSDAIEKLKGFFCKEAIFFQADPKTTFPYYERKAKEGYSWAQFMVGWHYDEGRGCQVDKAQAFHYYQLAAKQGLLEAKYKLGYFYQHGICCQADLNVAFDNYTEASQLCETDLIDFKNILFDFNKEAIYLQVDPSKAFNFYNKQANCKVRPQKDKSDAQAVLAYLYEEGIGCTKDTEKAIYYYRLAAHHAHPFAIKKYNQLYFSSRMDADLAPPPAKKQRRD